MSDSVQNRDVQRQQNRSTRNTDTDAVDPDGGDDRLLTDFEIRAADVHRDACLEADTQLTSDQLWTLLDDGRRRTLITVLADGAKTDGLDSPKSLHVLTAAVATRDTDYDEPAHVYVDEIADEIERVHLPLLRHYGLVEVSRPDPATEVGDDPVYAGPAPTARPNEDLLTVANILGIVDDVALGEGDG